jgi:hypothetical protein
VIREVRDIARDLVLCPSGVAHVHMWTRDTQEAETAQITHHARYGAPRTAREPAIPIDAPLSVDDAPRSRNRLTRAGARTVSFVSLHTRSSGL